MSKGSDITFSKEQTHAFDLLTHGNTTTKRVVYGGVAGGGKSWLICVWQIHQRLSYPGTRGYIAREELKSLKGSVLVTFFDVIHQLGIKIRYNDVKSQIHFPNGSMIQLLEVKYKPSDPDFHSLGSTEYTDGAIEEGVAVHKRAAELLLSRTRYKHDEFGLSAKQLITCNPGPGWIKDDVVLPHKQGIIKDKTKFIPATLESNPNKAFVRLYGELLDGLENPYDRARLRHGDWDAVPQTGGEFYKDFDQIAHTLEARKAQYDPDLAIHMTWDENVHPYLTCNLHQISTIGNTKVAMQFDEICLAHPRNTIVHTCNEFKRRYGHHIGGLFIYGDRTSKKEDVKLEKGFNFFTLVRQELEKYHPRLRIPSSNPNVIPRGNFINTVFRGNIEGLEIIISDICKETMLDYQQLKEDSDGKKKKEKVRNPETGVTYEKYGHCTDANDYFYCEAFKDLFTLYTKGKDAGPRKVVTRTRQKRY